MIRGRVGQVMDQPALKTRASRAFGSADKPWRVLGKLETASLEVEEAVYPPGLCMPRHCHKTSNFVYIIAGAHWAGDGQGGETCAPGTVRFLPAGEPHEGYFPHGAQCVHVDVNQSMTELAAEHGRTIRQAGELATPGAVALASRLRRELHRKDDFSRMEVEALALQLLLAEGMGPARQRNPTPMWLLRIREMLREEETSRLSLLELSRSSGRHPVQISRQFHQRFGCTISEYLRRVRVARAQSMLSRRDMSVAEIALVCGFFDQSHFTNAFRRITGVSPHRYRMRLCATEVSMENGRR